MPPLSVKTAEEAAFLYHIVLHELVHRFRPSDVPDFRHGRDGISGIVVPGILHREEKRPVWLKIILDPEAFREPDYMRRFNAVGTRDVKAPRIRMRGETSEGYPFFLADDAAGREFIDPQRYAGSPHTTWSQKHDISDAFWKASAVYLAPKTGLPGRGPAPEIFYDDNAVRWLRQAEENGAVAKRFLKPPTLVAAVETLREASTKIPAPGTYFSHAHFANPEVRTNGDRITLIDWGSAKFVPVMYDAAFWVWNAALHSWKMNAKEWLLETEDYEDAFCERGRHVSGHDFSENELRHAFRTALLERMLGAILVDCAEGTVAARPIQELRQVLQNCRVTLKALVDSF